jgi:hypothetical protein
MRTISVRTNATFFLEKGTCLEATTAVRMCLPAEILVSGTKIGDVISLSDDAIKVGFREADDKSRGFAAIVVFLRPGDRIELRRSTEVFFYDDEVKDVTLSVA